jgi:tetratricopeptide (TPR) repeat protein
MQAEMLGPGSHKRGRLALHLWVGVGSILLVACAGTLPSQAPAVATVADLTGSAPSPGASSTIPAAREKAIAAYRSYLQRYPAAPARREVMRRLADLLLERAAEGPPAGSAGGEDLPGQASPAAGRYAEAIEIYETLLQQAPEGESRAALLYQLARAYEESGQSNKAVALLTQMPEPARDSEPMLYADAQFRHGELLFGAKSYSEAEQAYRNVVALGEHTPVYVQALYKLGWSLFKQARYDEAVDVFSTLLDHKLPAGSDVKSRFSTFSRAEREQLTDVFRALSLCFSYTGGVRALAEHLEQGSRPYEDRLYRSLGARYEDEERYTDAAETYLALARRAPLTAEAPSLYLKVLEIYERAGFSERVLEVQAEFARAFALNGDFWRAHSPASMPEVIQRLQFSLLALGRHYHAQARQGGTAEAYREAERWYREYLRSFADSGQAAAVNFALAELLYEHGQYRQAAIEYERTAYGRGPHPLAGDAGYRAILARTEHEQALTGGLKESASRSSIANAMRFVATFPAHAEASEVLAMTGTELRARKDYDAAVGLSERLLQRQPAVPLGLRREASILRAEAQFERSDYQQAARGYKAALPLLEPGDPRQEKLRERWAASIYKQGQASLAQGDTSQAAAHFVRAARVTPGSPVRPKALYDAAAALLALKRWDEAVAMLERFQRAYPAHPLHQEAMRKLAFAYQESGRVNEAADSYLRLGQGPGDDGMRRAALLEAADLYQQADATDDAIAALEGYLDQFPRPVSNAVAVRQRLADLAKTQGEDRRRRHWLEQIVAADRSAGRGRSAYTRAQAAHAAVELAEPLVAAFDRTPLVEPLQDSLPRKLEAMKEALHRLEQAAGYGVFAVTTAATYQIANLYHELSRALLASERPRGLTGEERAQYELMLEEQAFPFEEKAIHFYEANVRRMGEGKADPWIAKSLERLAELVPGRYASKE